MIAVETRSTRLNGERVADAVVTLWLLSVRSAGRSRDSILGTNQFAGLVSAEIADDDPLAFGESGENLHHVRTLNSDLNLAGLDIVLGIDDEDTGLVVIALDGLDWNGQSVRATGGAQLDIGVHSGPQTVSGIGHLDFNLHGAGGRVEGTGKAGDFAGEVFAGSLHLHIRRIADLDDGCDSLGHRNAKTQDVDLGDGDDRQSSLKWKSQPAPERRYRRSAKSRCRRRER